MPSPALYFILALNAALFLFFLKSFFQGAYETFLLKSKGEKGFGSIQSMREGPPDRWQVRHKIVRLHVPSKYGDFEFDYIYSLPAHDWRGYPVRYVQKSNGKLIGCIDSWEGFYAGLIFDGSLVMCFGITLGLVLARI